MMLNAIKLTDAVVKVTGKDNRSFGTAFAIHQDEKYLYLLTCHHVVDDVGGSEGLKANGIPAEVIAFDPRDGFDLAVLRVDNSRLDVLRLRIVDGEPTISRFQTAGYFAYDKLTAGEEIRGVLKNEIVLRSDHRAKQSRAWNLEMDGDCQLQPGYSGAPVVNAEDNVIAVISLMRGEGKQGLAIGIETLTYIWPEMPSGLLRRRSTNQREQNQPNPNRTDPLMNFKDEIAAFKLIVEKQNPNIKLIVVHGPSGSGKSRLIKEYKNLARTNGHETLNFDFGPQITIEKCLDEIVDRLGIDQFERYHAFQLRGKPEPLTRSKEEEWQNNLTREFFADLSKFDPGLPLIVFFDQYEKADQAFRNWLVDIFLPRLYQKPLVVIVAGQDQLERTSSWEWKRHFELNGVSIDWYQRYAEACGVPFEFRDIKILHDVTNGMPVFIVNFVRMQQAAMERA